MECDERCRCGRDCDWDGRDSMLLDDCPQVDEHGKAVEGHGNCCPHNLSYLATMTEVEHEELAKAALEHLVTGWWAEFYVDSFRAVASGYAGGAGLTGGQRFVKDCRDGRWELNEGFVHDFANDLAGELRLMRGWCPHQR